MMLFMMLVFEFVNLFWHPDADKGVGGEVMLSTDRCGYKEEVSKVGHFLWKSLMQFRKFQFHFHQLFYHGCDNSGEFPTVN